MERIQADHLVVFSARFESLDSRTWLQRGTDIGQEECAALLAKVEELIEIGAKVGRLEIPSTLDQLERIEMELQSGDPLLLKGENGWHMFRSLHERFLDDMKRACLLTLSSKDAHLFSMTQAFGSKVYEAFPSATIDIEEAAKCLALHRGTATVFHLMRVMEAGLKATASVLEIQYAPSWESYLKQIKDTLDLKWKEKPQKWRRDEPFFRDVHAHLHAVKVAWRNPTMHIVQQYAPDTAEDVFNSVKGFMRHLATKLAEPPPKKSRVRPKS